MRLWLPSSVLLVLLTVAQRSDAMCALGPDEVPFELVEATIESCGPPGDDLLRIAAKKIPTNPPPEGSPLVDSEVLERETIRFLRKRWSKLMVVGMRVHRRRDIDPGVASFHTRAPDRPRPRLPSAGPWHRPSVAATSSAIPVTMAVAPMDSCDAFPIGARKKLRLFTFCCDQGALGSLRCALDWPYVEPTPAWVEAAGFADSPEGESPQRSPTGDAQE